ncbi:MAG: hypothetical protein AAFY50_19865, partial [Cyanobacteria bacterium J06648_1]
PGDWLYGLRIIVTLAMCLASKIVKSEKTTGKLNFAHTLRLMRIKYKDSISFSVVQNLSSNTKIHIGGAFPQTP